MGVQSQVLLQFEMSSCRAKSCLCIVQNSFFFGLERDHGTSRPGVWEEIETFKRHAPDTDPSPHIPNKMAFVWLFHCPVLSFY
jgi:hypothetical protein